jgi:hypothetical protein
MKLGNVILINLILSDFTLLRKFLWQRLHTPSYNSMENNLTAKGHVTDINTAHPQDGTLFVHGY